MRPNLRNIEAWDAKHPQIANLVKRYCTWCDDPDAKISSQQEYENDILSCFAEWNHDGFHLAQHLNSRVYIYPDAELVEILDSVGYIALSVGRQIISKWVLDNNLKLPDNLIGKSCFVTTSKVMHYITSVYPETYEVTISTNKDSKGGYKHGFERIYLVEQ